MTLNVQQRGGRAWYDAFPFEAPTPVSGLGDEAVEDLDIVYAVQGDSAVVLSHLYSALEPDMARALVEAALTRL